MMHDPPIPEAGSLITAEQLTRVYNGVTDTVTKAVNDVNLVVRAGEIILILGPSGSGKTTLLSMLGCLLRPTSGRLIVFDRDLTTTSAPEMAALRRAKIGFVFQSYRLLDCLSVIENVRLAMVLAGVPAREAGARAAARLADLGILHRAEFPPARLSGGEKQRVAIARALANEPRLILADEPTGNLDSQSGRTVMEVLSDRARAASSALVIVSHDPRIRDLADRVLTMEDGRLRE